MVGADSGFARVYSDNVWRVYGFLAYRVSARELAEDLTQATFERALRAWSRFDPRRASEHTWLLAIAHNVLIDHYRRGRFVSNDPIDEGGLPPVSGPEERYNGSAELISALGQLSQRDRDVLALRFGGDLSGRDIAELLGLSLANVQQILSRSLRKLRTLLENGQMTPALTSTPSPTNRAPAPVSPATTGRSHGGRGP
jgi:RNA polymerase sigma-70 factor (ECF subfamily)